MEQMRKIGIIAGSDLLPKHVVDSCIKQNIDFVLVGLTGQTTEGLFNNISYETFQIYTVSKIIKYLKEQNVTHVVLAGKVQRVGLTKLLRDLKGAKLLANILANGTSDNTLLSTILKFFEKEGFAVLAPEELVQDIVIKEGKITEIEPSKEDWEDIEKGMQIIKGIAQFDIGQSLIIQEGLVLGVEAAEGTDELIKRCSNIQQKDMRGAILIKVVKPKQDKRVDLPCIGPNTIKNLSEGGLIGVAIEAGAALILDEEATVKCANELGIFIYGL